MDLKVRSIQILRTRFQRRPSGSTAHQQQCWKSWMIWYSVIVTMVVEEINRLVIALEKDSVQIGWPERTKILLLRQNKKLKRTCGEILWTIQQIGGTTVQTNILISSTKNLVKLCG